MTWSASIVFMGQWSRFDEGGLVEAEAAEMWVLLPAVLWRVAACFDECRAVAASQQMNRKLCWCERASSMCMYVLTFTRMVSYARKADAELLGRVNGAVTVPHLLCTQVNSHNDWLNYHHHASHLPLPQDHHHLIHCNLCCLTASLEMSLLSLMYFELWPNKHCRLAIKYGTKSGNLMQNIKNVGKATISSYLSFCCYFCCLALMKTQQNTSWLSHVIFQQFDCLAELSTLCKHAFLHIHKWTPASPVHQVLPPIFSPFSLQQPPAMHGSKFLSSTTNHSYAFWDNSPATEGLGEKPIS